MEDKDLDKLSENVMALLREMSQRQTMMFHLLREIYEESRLPIKLVREVEEDVYLSRRNPRDRGFSGRDEDDREGGYPMAQLEGRSDGTARRHGQPGRHPGGSRGHAGDLYSLQLSVAAEDSAAVAVRQVQRAVVVRAALALAYEGQEKREG